MAEISFVLRDLTGAIQSGSIELAGASSALRLSPGDEVSVNAYPAQISGIIRQGSSLQVLLANGDTIVLDGYFGADGTPSSALFISAGGELYRVEVGDNGSGALSYGFELQAPLGKYDAQDEFYFLRGPELLVDDQSSEDASGLAGYMLPLAGLGAAALAVGGLGGKKSGDDGEGSLSQTSSTSSRGSVKKENAESGTGSAGHGGDGGGGIDPNDGGGQDQAPIISVLYGTKEAGVVVNGKQFTDGITLGGVGTPGGTVTIDLAGVVASTTVDEAGNWELTIPTDAVPDGEYDQEFTATITNEDGVGSDDKTVAIDTETFIDFAPELIEGDDVINRAEASDGVVLTGQTEVGATVSIEFLGEVYDAPVSDAGVWEVRIPSDIFDGVDESATAVAMTTDAVGNTATDVRDLLVDTVRPDVPHIASITRTATSLRSVSVAQADEGLRVTRVDENGTAEDVNFDLRPNEAFEEIDLVFDAPIPDGSQLVLSSTDAAGNQNATIFLLDESRTNNINLENDRYDDFDVEAVDLSFADSSELQLTSDIVASLSQNTDHLIIHGREDDTVSLEGAVNTGDRKMLNDRSFDMYSFGDDDLLVAIDSAIRIE